jgi:hypothetical protein
VLERPTLLPREEFPRFPYIAGAQMGYGKHPGAYHATFMMGGGEGGICVQVFAGTFHEKDGRITPPMAGAPIGSSAGAGAAGPSSSSPTHGGPRSRAGSESGAAGAGCSTTAASSGAPLAALPPALAAELAGSTSLCNVGDATLWSPLPLVFASLDIVEPSPQRFGWCELSEGGVEGGGGAGAGLLALGQRPYKTLFIPASDPSLRAFRQRQGSAERPTPLHVGFYAVEGSEEGGEGGGGGGGGGGAAATAAAPKHRPTSFFCVAHNVLEEPGAATAAPEAAAAAAPAPAPAPAGAAAAVHCARCGGSVPAANAERHEAFCARNLSACSRCGAAVARAAAHRHLHCAAAVTSGSAAAAAARAPCPAVCASPTELARHARVFHAPFACALCGAGPAFHPGEAFEAHLRSQCGDRRIYCEFPGCFLEMREAEMAAHVQECGAKTVEHSCGYYVLRRDWAAHLASACAVGRGGRVVGGRPPRR